MQRFHDIAFMLDDIHNNGHLESVFLVGRDNIISCVLIEGPEDFPEKLPRGSNQMKGGRFVIKVWATEMSTYILTV